MARIRTIKPEFFRSRTIDKLTAEQRLTFVGLWTHCDDEGRCEFDPELIKADVWPRSRSLQDVVGDLQAITDLSLLTHYKVSERSFLQVNGWREHQRINRPTPSKLPKPDEGEIVPLTSEYESSVETHTRVSEGSRETLQGKEGKGRERNKDLLTASRRARDDEAFEDFWATYPRKVGKDAARKAWLRVVKETSTVMVIEGAKNYAQQRQGEDQQFTAYPATWLNAGRWADELPQPDLGGEEFQLPTPPRDVVDDPDPAVYVRWAKAQRDAWAAARTGRSA